MRTIWHAFGRGCTNCGTPLLVIWRDSDTDPFMDFASGPGGPPARIETRCGQCQTENSWTADEFVLYRVEVVRSAGPPPPGSRPQA